MDSWVRTKCQFIILTLNDVLTRVFDSLITGNLIIIPVIFKHEECLIDLHQDDCVYYNDDDIYNPYPIIHNALEKY